VTVGRLAVAKDVVIAASRGGKLKTVLQLLALTAYLVPLTSAWVDHVAWWSLLAAVLIAVVTGVHIAMQITRAGRAHPRRGGSRTHAATVNEDPPDVRPWSTRSSGARASAWSHGCHRRVSDWRCGVCGACGGSRGL